MANEILHYFFKNCLWKEITPVKGWKKHGVDSTNTVSDQQHRLLKRQYSLVARMVYLTDRPIN